MIKRFVYRDTPEMLISLCILLSCIPLAFIVDACILLGITCAVVVLVVIHEKWNAKLNAGKKFFWCKRSILKKKKIWITQKAFISKENNSCPQYEFVEEMVGLLKDIPDGITCYCCTHEVIKKKIVKHCANVELTPIYKKNIKRLKKAIRTDKCKKCNKRDCSIFQNEEIQFYAIKFVK